MSSSGISLIILTSWLVLKPSKKWRKGTEESIADKWDTKPKLYASWTLVDAKIANPVCLQA